MKESSFSVIDIHYHLLFGLDDGPKTIEDSLALAQASIAEGVTHIVATPHANARYPFQPETNREQLAMLQARLGDKLTLALGCDFHLSYDNIEDLKKHPAKYAINGGPYVLVEFPDYGISQNMTGIFFEMKLAGVTSIITHPERNPTLKAAPERMMEWVSSGCLVQVTAASLTGRFGSRAQALALDLVRRNWVHLVASDAHSLERRPPAMGPAYALLKEQCGQATADRLCIHNPRAVFYGEPLPQQPEPHGLYEKEGRSRGGFLRRLLGR